MNGKHSNKVELPTTDRHYERLSIDDIEKMINRSHKLYLAPDGSITVTPHSLAAIEDRSADLERLLEERDREVQRLQALINTPHTHDFLEAVKYEMPHQRERWGAEHGAGKTALDWFWLIGYLAQKATYSFLAGDIEKAKHHVITTAAALGNWFLSITGESTAMRPGIDPAKTLGASHD